MMSAGASALEITDIAVLVPELAFSLASRGRRKRDRITSRTGCRGSRLTQQYIVGEFSSLLETLQPVPSARLGNALNDLRRDVELGSLPTLPRLAQEAMTLTDAICWVALEQGDLTGFSRYASTAVALREFTVSANLLP
jgi:hypothetical protein